MASFHHCHHPTPVTTTYCCRRCCCDCTPSHYSPPPDPLLQSIASHLLHHPPPTPPQPNLQSPHLTSPYTHPTEYHSHQIHKHTQHSGKYLYQEDDEDGQQTLPVVSSLIRRIAALESSLRHHSPAHYSLRDAAARTIQTHFRAFLVRRSRTLRQLKDLAFIKSAFNTLKSSLSDCTHFDYKALSQEAMGLLVKLDSIQGGDPMIRDGKRSISRELIRFMEFIDEVSLKKHVPYSNRAVKNVGFGRNVTKPRVMLGDHRKRTVDSGRSDGDERKLLEELRNRVQKIEEFSRVYEEDVGVGNQGVSTNGNHTASQNRIGGLVKRQGGVQVLIQPKVKKNVSFVENGNVYSVIRSSRGPGSSGDSDSFDENDLVDGVELMNNLCKEVEEIGVSPKEAAEDKEEAATEDEESPQVTDEERDPRRNMRNQGDYEIRKQLDQEEDGGFVFSAPLPVKMEARVDLMNKKQPVRK